MSMKCENCNAPEILEEDRINWYQELSANNLILHKKVMEQQELILILRKKLLEKRTTYISNFLVDSTKYSSNNDIERSGHSGVQLLEKRLHKKIEEIGNFMAAFANEKESFQEKLEEQERNYEEHISYLRGLADYYREAAFDELDKSNQLKLQFAKKMAGFTVKNQHFRSTMLKELLEQVDDELQQRYKRAINKNRKEIENQHILIMKLRKHSCQLYSVISKNKQQFEQNLATILEELKRLKLIVAQLRKRNNDLETRIKLQVEGCQNDIFDARKKINKLTNPGSK